MQKRGNKNNNNDNKENNMLNPIHTTSDNKNPLAPVIRGKDYEPNKESVKINNFIACILDDDDDGEEVVIDIKNSLFRKNKGNNSPNINPNNNETLAQTQISSDNKENYLSIEYDDIDYYDVIKYDNRTFFQYFFCHILNLTWKGRTKHYNLSLGSYISYYF